MSDDSDPSIPITVVGNHVYFYTPVNIESCLSLILTLRQMESEYLVAYDSYVSISDAPPIWLHLNTYGGDLFSGFAVADAIMMLKVPVHTIIEGACASSGTLISNSGTKRYMTQNSFMMIHQLSATFDGTYHNMIDSVAAKTDMMKRIVNFYVSRTNKKTDANIINKLLKRDMWLNSISALRLGLIDEIL